jgi:pimeloyl-ACP methyl ester carboxylesterase
LLLPGWPDTAWSYRHVIPLLTEPRPGKDFVFEVISANLPGIGFSEAPSKPGCGPIQAGIIFKKLMDRLGFKKFYIEAGDWGALAGITISVMYPERYLKFIYRTFSRF